MNTPIRFQPYLRPMVWGGRRLGEILGKALPDNGSYGEAWELSDHASHRSVVPDGPRAGRSIRQLLEADPVGLVGSRTPGGFPWLIKFLDASDWLSVQVHPDDTTVKTLWPGEGGKTEAWFVLSADPGSKVYAGLKPGVGEPELRAALLDGSAADCLHQFTPEPGDCLFLPAGTVHAVGGGVLIAEIQQTSDATFRLFDWNRVDASGRSRQLHIDQGLAAIDWTAGPTNPVKAHGFPRPGEVAPAEPVRQRLVNCQYFTLDYVRQVRPFAAGGSGQMQVLIAVHGSGTLRSPEGLMPFTSGETILLPAGLPEVWVHPEGALGLLAATLPTANSGSSYLRAG